MSSYEKAQHKCPVINFFNFKSTLTVFLTHNGHWSVFLRHLVAGISRWASRLVMAGGQIERVDPSTCVLIRRTMTAVVRRYELRAPSVFVRRRRRNRLDSIQSGSTNLARLRGIRSIRPGCR